MIDRFIDWFFSRSKIERVLFVIDFILLLLFLSCWGDFLTSGGSVSGEVIL